MVQRDVIFNVEAQGAKAAASEIAELSKQFNQAQQAADRLAAEEKKVAEARQLMRDVDTGARDLARFDASLVDPVLAGRAELLADAMKEVDRVVEDSLSTMREFGGTQEQLTRALATLEVTARDTGIPIQVLARGMRGIIDETENAEQAIKFMTKGTEIAQVSFLKAEDASKRFGMALKGDTAILRDFDAEAQKAAEEIDTIADVSVRAERTLQALEGALDRARKSQEQTGRAAEKAGTTYEKASRFVDAFAKAMVDADNAISKAQKSIALGAQIATDKLISQEQAGQLLADATRGETAVLNLYGTAARNAAGEIDQMSSRKLRAIAIAIKLRQENSRLGKAVQSVKDAYLLLRATYPGVITGTKALTAGAVGLGVAYVGLVKKGINAYIEGNRKLRKQKKALTKLTKDLTFMFGQLAFEALGLDKVFTKNGKSLKDFGKAAKQFLKDNDTEIKSFIATTASAVISIIGFADSIITFGRQTGLFFEEMSEAVGGFVFNLVTVFSTGIPLLFFKAKAGVEELVNDVIYLVNRLIDAFPAAAAKIGITTIKPFDVDLTSLKQYQDAFEMAQESSKSFVERQAKAADERERLGKDLLKRAAERAVLQAKLAETAEEGTKFEKRTTAEGDKKAADAAKKRAEDIIKIQAEFDAKMAALDRAQAAAERQRQRERLRIQQEGDRGVEAQMRKGQEIQNAMMLEATARFQAAVKSRQTTLQDARDENDFLFQEMFGFTETFMANLRALHVAEGEVAIGDMTSRQLEILQAKAEATGMSIKQIVDIMNMEMAALADQPIMDEQTQAMIDELNRLSIIQEASVKLFEDLGKAGMDAFADISMAAGEAFGLIITGQKGAGDALTSSLFGAMRSMLPVLSAYGAALMQASMLSGVGVLLAVGALSALISGAESLFGGGSGGPATTTAPVASTIQQRLANERDDEQLTFNFTMMFGAEFVEEKMVQVMRRSQELHEVRAGVNRRA